MDPIKRRARIAGWLYLLLAVSAPIRLIYLPNTLFVHGDAEATAANIAAHEGLFRLGIVTDLFTGTISLFLTLSLFRLFKGVDMTLAVLMTVLGLMDTPLYFFNVLNDVTTLLLVQGGDYLAAFTEPQRASLAMLHLRMHGQVVGYSQIFWGLWLFPLAILVIRSGFIARFIGYWLILNGFAYLAISLTGLLWPSHEDLVSSIAFPAQLGEIALVLWLVIVGARVRASSA
ncbi:DUF4386 domain-containing protein [Dyella solisilvae]|uniref:DUF4386 domain-containing protein n=1 Tax=Dyella solisilvae TaxID=1920168 RepID=A0A370K2Q3_9GAMM|nr:DUF4386 domain-containing protein [Dyella solisilvae]RDI96878.1 DUF4386 domain-containing protein [Dyella solisilvae]